MGARPYGTSGPKREERFDPDPECSGGPGEQEALKGFSEMRILER